MNDELEKIAGWLRGRGLEVLETKIGFLVRCPNCRHEWVIRILPYELERTEPNPNWGTCYACRMGGRVGAV